MNIYKNSGFPEYLSELNDDVDLNIIMQKSSKNAFLQANKKLFDGIIETKNNNEETILMVGSNRQSYAVELTNSQKQRNPLAAVSGLELITEYFNKNKINIEIDKLLLADIQNNRSDGESFHEIKQKIHDKKSSNDWPQTTRNNPNDYEDIHDSNKLLLLYAQIHHIANKNQGKQITFDFYDDNTQIVQSLYNFFSNNPKAIPNNINLCIHQYGNIQVGNQLNERETLFHFRPIQGTGEVDTEYKKTIQEIPLSAAVKFYQSKKNIEVAQDDIKARADTIKYTKETNKCLATFITYDDIKKISYSFDLKKNVDFLKSQLDAASTTDSKRYRIGLDNESYFVSKEMYNQCKPFTKNKGLSFEHKREIDEKYLASPDFKEQLFQKKSSLLNFPLSLFNQTTISTTKNQELNN